MRVQGVAAARFALWSLVLLGCPAAALTAVMHPAWDLDATLSAIPLVSGSALGLLYTGTRWRPAPRPAHARHTGMPTLRQLLWAGFFTAPFLIAIAAADPVRLRVLDYCGTALLLTCPAALALRWWFRQRARQPVDRTFYELRQRQAWNEHELGAIRRAVTEAFRHAGRDVSGALDEHGVRRRHLRPVRPAVSDDTGPQQAVLS